MALFSTVVEKTLKKGMSRKKRDVETAKINRLANRTLYSSCCSFGKIRVWSLVWIDESEKREEEGITEGKICDEGSFSVLLLSGSLLQHKHPGKRGVPLYLMYDMHRTAPQSQP